MHLDSYILHQIFLLSQYLIEIYQYFNQIDKKYIFMFKISFSKIYSSILYSPRAGRPRRRPDVFFPETRLPDVRLPETFFALDG